jgi:hypothetical protein
MAWGIKFVCVSLTCIGFRFQNLNCWALYSRVADSVLGKCEILIQENTLIRENIKQRMILLKTLHFLNFMLSGSCWSIFSASGQRFCVVLVET